MHSSSSGMLSSVLTSGVEYFSVASDDEAIAFGRGVQAEAVSVFRADGIEPDGYLALLGSLLAAESMTALTDPERTIVLSREERDDGSILIVRVTDSITRALQAADPDTLSEVARRALSYPDFAGANEEVVTELLTRLASTAIHGRLYARVILVESERSQPRKPAPLIVFVIVACVGFIGSVALAFFLNHITPGLGSPAYWLGAVSILPLVFTIRMRATQRIADLDPGAMTLRVATDRSSPRTLTDDLTQVAGIDSAPQAIPPGKTVYLSFDPGGLVLRVGATEAVRVPRSSIVAVRFGSAKIRFSRVERTKLPTLEFDLRSHNDSVTTWSVPILTSARTKPNRAESEQIVQLVRLRLGLPD